MPEIGQYLPITALWRKSALGFRTNMQAALLSFSLLMFSAVFAGGSEYEWEGVPRVVALGDIHGSLGKLTDSLRAAGLIDERLQWKGGVDHVVLCGDLVDRGPDDRKVLNLVQALQEEARRAGGRVHVLIGNHEVLNLARDLRYVAPESYAAFVPDEESGARQKGWEGFRKTMSKPGVDEAMLKAAFEQRCPPGYFARLKAFGKAGRYGSWALKLPATVKINGVVFVHAGLTPETAGPGLDSINRQIAGSLRAIVESIESLDPLLGFPGSYSEYLGIAQTFKSRKNAAEGSLPPEVYAAADSILKQIQGPAFAPDGPLWYRGNSLENERAEREPFGRVLKLLSARALVVGHSITGSREITSRFQSCLYRVDVGMAYGGKPAVLILEQGEAKVLDPSNMSVHSPAAEPPPGESWAMSYEHIPDAQMERFLADAEIMSRTELKRGSQRAEIFELKGGKQRMRSVFKSIDQGKLRADRPVSRYQHEIAAYWLDRRLGIGMVPTVIVRTVGGKDGSLRAVIETAIDIVSIRSYTGLEQVERDEALRRLAERYNLDLKELMGQAAIVRTFDALIGNPGREDEDRLWIPRDRKVALVDHERAFTLNTNVDPSLLCEYLDPNIRLAMQSLQLEELRAGLSRYLSEEQIGALLTRRNRVLERCPSVAAVSSKPQARPPDLRPY